MTKTTQSLPSAARYEAGDAQPAALAVKLWAPDGEPKAVLQLHHGMVEYIDRYDAFATSAADRGYLVAGLDFIGHGDSATPAQLGHTGVPPADGSNVFVADAAAFRDHLDALYPGLPHFIFGHSMGSFVVRAYLAQRGAGLAGAVIMGTGTVPAATVKSAAGLLGLFGRFYPPDHHSPFFAKLVLGANNKPFAKGGRTPFDWLSRDPAEVDKYIADPRCGGTFTLAANRQLLQAFSLASDPAAYDATPKDLPLLVVSGQADPVGGMGAGVRQVVQAYRAAGVKDVTCLLYPEARHEILNETNKAAVAGDLLDWLDAHAPRREAR
jgi:alpha-beta hydrolase superfamily lysophospholipase